MSMLDTTDKARRDRALIEDLIEDPSRLGPDFQPIKRLNDGTLVGYKATGRGQRGTALDNTLALLHSAQSSGLVERLDSAVSEWRSWGWRVVLADVSHLLDAALLRRLDVVRPEVVQVDVSKPSASGSQVQELLTWAALNGAEVHATGVDLEARKAMAV